MSTILSKLEVARRAEAAAYLARHTTTPGISVSKKEREARVGSSQFIPYRCRLAALGFSLRAMLSELVTAARGPNGPPPSGPVLTVLA